MKEESINVYFFNILSGLGITNPVKLRKPIHYKKAQYIPRFVHVYPFLYYCIPYFFFFKITKILFCRI